MKKKTIFICIILMTNMINNQLNKIYSGRWYQTNLNLNAKSFDDKKKSLTIKLKNVELEDYDTGKINVKNLNIFIFLSPMVLKK